MLRGDCVSCRQELGELAYARTFSAARGSENSVCSVKIRCDKEEPVPAAGRSVSASDGAACGGGFDENVKLMPRPPGASATLALPLPVKFN